MSEKLPEAPAKWLCKECYEICEVPLSAKNPFEEDDTISGCPHCKQVNSLVGACQAEGCKLEATGGSPNSHGYRYFFSCHKHFGA